ncbi:MULTISPECIES: class I SAM-dependent methyltransferase [Streptomyces]|uniref:Class I SAM-dependent methyltransferase n=1 Tax=Streptomyces noboritoensis TaxID=67337 RepID=A0ABV6TCI8_9ACTN|nr:class I SAM-dependent methyltransferase [Streptomyces melanogenes]GGP78593.1 hypothetical protein GCM10010278_66330 [Streptomyces melanogenes]
MHFEPSPATTGDDRLDPPAPGLTAAQWDTWYLTGAVRQVAQVEAEQFSRYTGPRPGQTAVDIGCGVGTWTRQLARWGLSVTGYDYSSEAIKRARRLAGPNETYQPWDVDAAPVPPDHALGSVDIVTCRLSLPYLDWPRLRTTVTPWLSNGGVFHALIPVEEGSAPTHRDPFRRGMTEEQIQHLDDGWAFARRYRTRSRHLTGLILRGWHGQTTGGGGDVGHAPPPPEAGPLSDDGARAPTKARPPPGHQEPERARSPAIGPNKPLPP